MWGEKMEKGKLIPFSVNDKFTREKLLKFITSEEIDECVENGYFKKVQETENGEQITKYVFTQKGKDHAWG